MIYITICGPNGYFSQIILFKVTFWADTRPRYLLYNALNFITCRVKTAQFIAEKDYSRIIANRDDHLLLNILSLLVEPSSRVRCRNPGAAEKKKTINEIPTGTTFKYSDLIWERFKSMKDLVNELTEVSNVEKVHPPSAGGAVQDDVGAASPEVVTEKERMNERTNFTISRPVENGLEESE